jgi:hypothetical protein
MSRLTISIVEGIISLPQTLILGVDLRNVSTRDIKDLWYIYPLAICEE